MVNKLGSNKIKEKVVRDALKSRVGGMPEVLSPSGSIDLLTRSEVIEVKHYRGWKEGIGQVVAYGSHYPSRGKRLHLFAPKGDTRASKYVELAESVCLTCEVRVTFEEVIHVAEAVAPGGGAALSAEGVFVTSNGKGEAPDGRGVDTPKTSDANHEKIKKQLTARGKVRSRRLTHVWILLAYPSPSSAPAKSQTAHVLSYL